MQAVERGNIELAIVFNGTAEPQRLNEWIAEQTNVRQKVGMASTFLYIYTFLFTS